jgi:hypothetical protein
VTSLPTICRALDVEMMRDGGSLAATFEDESGHRHILFTQIKLVGRDPLTIERVGYDLPVLIDCDPAERPPDTDQRQYSELSGPKTLLTWDQARVFMGLAKDISEGLDQSRQQWLDYMDYVVTNDGDMPPSMEIIMRVSRPPNVDNS